MPNPSLPYNMTDAAYRELRDVSFRKRDEIMAMTESFRTDRHVRVASETLSERDAARQEGLRVLNERLNQACLRVNGHWEDLASEIWMLDAELILRDAVHDLAMKNAAESHRPAMARHSTNIDVHALPMHLLFEHYNRLLERVKREGAVGEDTGCSDEFINFDKDASAEFSWDVLTAGQHE